MTKIDQCIQENKTYFIETLKKLIEIPSVCGDHIPIDQAVVFIDQLLQKLFNCQPKILQTSGSPVIFCQLGNGQPANKGILFYGHYDVMSAEDLEKWQFNPFELTLSDSRLYGRGAGDNKGQLLDVIFGLYVYQQLHSEFPCQINLLFEGEEENGSRNLKQVVKQLSIQELRQTTAVYVIDGSYNFAGQHVLRLGNRGLLGLELTLKTNKNDLHSGNFGNISPNPVLIFHQLLETLYDFQQQRVRIPEFYDGIQSTNQAEINLLKKLPVPDTLINQSYSPFFKEPQNKVEYYQALMFEPSFNINGIQSGFLGEGIKTIIPGRLKVRFDFRLVKGQRIDKIQQEIERLLVPWKELLTIKYPAVIPPYYAGIENRLIKKVFAGIQQVDSQAVIEPVMPGTVPNYVWQENLAAPVFTIPLANYDQHNHAPNENIQLDAFLEGIKVIYHLVKIYQV